MENTPPETALVRKRLSQFRSALTDIQADYGSAKVVTPDYSKGVHFSLPTGLSQGRPASSAASSAADGSETLADVLLYTNPALSFLFVLGGALTLTTGSYLMSSSSQWTLLTAVCYVLLAELALNFGRSLVSAAPDAANWRSGALAHAVVAGVTRAVDAAASLHDRFLTARDPSLTLKVAAGLWALSQLGRAFSAWTLLSAAFVLAFTVPVAAAAHAAALSAAYAQVAGEARARWAALGLTRKQCAAGLAVLVAGLWWRSAWSTRLLGAFLAALAVRCNLRPSEVAAIREHAAPLTRSVKKSAARMSVAASDFAQRNGLTMHFR